MKQTIIQGDITDQPGGANVVIHQANVNGVMGAGVALAIATRWPGACLADEQAHFMATRKVNNHATAESLLGKHSKYVHEEDECCHVYNLYGQVLGGAIPPLDIPTSYDAVIAGLESIGNDLLEEVGKGNISAALKIAVPQGMGCLRGGANWEIYRAILIAWAEAFEEKLRPQLPQFACLELLFVRYEG
jgi:O-acetyl-ADP-ribose deacetylase (regulator of RNase III)